MGRWEYLTIEIAFEHNHDYVVTFTSGRKLYGLKAILEEFDARGWEYLHMVPNLSKLGSYHFPTIYIAFFRRPRTAGASQRTDLLE